MIERHIAFNIIDGKDIDFENFLDESYIPAMNAQPGFISASILRETDVTNKYKAVFRFENLAAAAAWRASEVHKEHNPILKSFYLSSEVMVYEVRITTDTCKNS